MSDNTTYIYCDASFDKAEKLAVVGFVIFPENRLHLEVIAESSNIRAELRAVIWALEQCTGARSVVIYTDCQNVVGLPARRQKLENTGFMSGNTHQPLTNTDLYKEFYARFDKVKPKIIWLKGHTPSKGRDDVQKNFSTLDRAVRKKLREAVGSPD